MAHLLISCFCFSPDIRAEESTLLALSFRQTKIESNFIVRYCSKRNAVRHVPWPERWTQRQFCSCEALFIRFEPWNADGKGYDETQKFDHSCFLERCLVLDKVFCFLFNWLWITNDLICIGRTSNCFFFVRGEKKGTMFFGRKNIKLQPSEEKWL